MSLNLNIKIKIQLTKTEECKITNITFDCNCFSCKTCPCKDLCDEIFVTLKNLKEAKDASN